MKTLLIMRHAKSSWKDASRVDHDRPLNKRGKNDAPRLGRLLLAESLVPDLIITSSAKRAKQTAKRLAAGCGYQGELIVEENLYLAKADTYLDLIQHLPETADVVLLIGHNPLCEEMVERWTGQFVTMPTATVAQLTLATPFWSDFLKSGAPVLETLWKPRELEDA